MSLRIRRGTNAERLQTALDLGEIAYTTDTKKLYVGDGVTLGGNHILSTSAGTGLSWNNETQTLNLSTTLLSTSDIVEGTNLYFTPERAQDATSTLFTHSDHVGISFVYGTEEDAANKIVATVTTNETDVRNIVSPMFTTGPHNGISFSYNSETNLITATVTANQEYIEDKVNPMFVHAGHTGITFNYVDNGSNPGIINAVVDVFPVSQQGMLYDDGFGTLTWKALTIEDDTAPALGGDLDLSNYSIIGTGDISITGSIQGTGTVSLGGTILDPALTIGYTAGPSFGAPGSVSLTTIENTYIRTNANRVFLGNNTQSSRLYVYSYREPDVNALVLRSYNGVAPSDPLANPTTDPKGNSISLNRARGSGSAPLSVETGDALHSIIYSAHDGTNFATPAIKIEATVDGPVAANAVPATYSVSTCSASGLLVSAFSINSKQTVSAPVAFKLPTYANVTARDAGIPTPEAGMIVFLTDRGSSNPGLQISTDGSTWTDI